MALVEQFGTGPLPFVSGLLVVKRGPNAGSRFPLGRYTLSAGRHPNSDIFLDDVTASRRHAEFHCAGGRFWVTDLSSLNGVYLNDVPVRSAALSDGDEIQIGKFQLMFLAGLDLQA
nr:FHA domain-containing protein [Mycolicibacter acidiphilus]